MGLNPGGDTAARNGATRALQHAAGISVMSLLLTGCGLAAFLLGGEPGPLEFSATDPIIECFVTVRNPDAQAELGVTEVPEQSLHNRTEPFLAQDGSMLRPYYSQKDCATDRTNGELLAFASPNDAAAEWRRFAQQRILDLSADPQSSSIFRTLPGDWCEVPGTVLCRETDEPIQVCETRGEPITTTPLPECAPREECLKITCGTDGSCPQIDFGDVPVGVVASKTVTLTNNCGVDTAVTFGGIVDPTSGPWADFEVPTADNTCSPPNPDDGNVVLTLLETCSFVVEFEPMNPGEHGGEISFTSEPPAALHTVGLIGTAEGGLLNFEEILPDGTAQQLPVAEICFDVRTQANCTDPREIRVTNIGPGAVTIKTTEFQPPAPGFKFIAQPTTPLTDDQSDSFEIQWCGGANTPENTNLRVVSNSDDPNDPNDSNTFIQPLRRAPEGC